MADDEKPAVFSKEALRAIQEWRQLPGKRYQREATSLSSRVHEVLGGLGLGDQFTEQELTEAWRDLVGDFLASHSRPGSMHNDVLEIRLLQPSMLYMLEREQKPLLLNKLQQRFGKERIRDVKFRIG